VKYGNCLIGALILLWAKRRENPKFLFKNRIGSIVPHFMVRTRSQIHHYKTDKDLLPWPLCYVLFQGSFQSIPLDQEDQYRKN
jgi:hypothetical protein